MRVLLCFLFLFLTGLLAEGQQIIWEKYWPNISGEFSNMVSLEDGSYLACGFLKIKRNYLLSNQHTEEGYYVVKIDAEGDTIWTRKYNVDVNVDKPFIFNNGNGTFTMVYVSFVPNLSFVRIIWADAGSGSLLGTNIINNFGWPMLGGSIDAEGKIYLVGYWRKPLVPTEDEMYCLKISQSGQVVFHNGYSPANFPISAAQYIEPMPGGKMRMSGNKGKTIVAYELNADGTVADYKEYMDNPYNYVQQDGAYVQQSDSGHFLVSVGRFSGAPSNANVRGAVAKMDRNGSFVWHGYRARSGTKPWPLLDGGYAITTWDASNGYFQRYHGDSTLFWEVNHSITSADVVRGFNGMLFENNEGISYGQLSKFLVNSGDYAYIAKIANVGYPVDPTNPIPPVVGVKDQKKKGDVGYAVPNPTTGIFHVLGMGSGHFRMTDAQGRTVMEAEHKGGDAIDVSALPCGVYTYTLVTKGSRTEGRIVRE